MQLAFYKGKKRVFDRMVQWWTRSPYSHCELVFGYRLGIAECATSSKMDGGVRLKKMILNPDHWDIVDLPWADVRAARNWFELHDGERYDVQGLLGFIAPISGRGSEWFCSEACAAALGYDEPWRFSPAILHNVVSFLSVKNVPSDLAE